MALDVGWAPKLVSCALERRIGGKCEGRVFGRENTMDFLEIILYLREEDAFFASKWGRYDRGRIFFELF